MKTIYYNNGTNEKRFQNDESIPDGWVPGRLKSPVTTLGSKWYTNGETNILVAQDSLVPDGFYLGRVNFHDVTKQAHTLKSKGYKHYNNGEQEILLSGNEQVPEGYVAGRLKMTEAQKEKLSQSHLGLKHSQDTKKKISRNSNNNREKAKKTIVDKYGSLEAFYKHVVSESEKTKRKNNSFNTTVPEREYYEALCEEYGKENVKQNYKSDLYPYRCDIYIVPLDKYIELNFHWTHGFQPYDENSSECKQRLDLWKEKAKTSQYYSNAIRTWTVCDPEKVACAKKNALNYEVIY